jgi:putative transposase
MLGVALHVIQRGRGRAPCFSCAEDRIAYLELLAENAAHCECAVHAYVLMANHVHLLVTPTGAHGVSQLAQALCDRYQRYVAEAYGSESCLWEERREIRPVHARRYVLACMRYIELNPVRAHIVARPQDFRWSSFRSNALGAEDPVVTPHPIYYALGRSPEARRKAYARFVQRGWWPGAQLEVNDPEAPEAV